MDMVHSDTRRPSTAERAVYVTLNDPDREIRLFALNHGSGNDELRGELLNFSLAEVQQAGGLTFEALSYAWGDPNDTVQIVCRMGSTSSCITSKVSITKNLYAALKQFRLLAETRLLWIDALCINQLDIPERNSQVKHMADIYSSARRVLVWLGEAHGNSNPFEAVDLYIAEMDRKRYSNVWSGFQNAPSELVMEALPLFARPWFRRKWIIQEVLLAKDVLMHCGCFEYRFEWFQRFGYHGSSYSAFRPTQVIYINTPSFQQMMHAATGISNMLLIDQFRHGEMQRSLANLLMETRQFECTDPRDYVFSVLSIAKDVEKNGVWSLQADYSLSLEEVVLNTTKWMIEHHGLDILSQTTGDDWSASFGQAMVRSSWSASGLLQAVNKSRDDLVNPLTASLTDRIVRNWGRGPPASSYVVKTMVQKPNILHTSGKLIDRIDVVEVSSCHHEGEAWKQQPFGLNNYRAVESTYIRNRLRRWWKLVQPTTNDAKGSAAVDEPAKQSERLHDFGQLIFCGNLVDHQSLRIQVPDYGNLLSQYEVYLEHWMKNPSPPLWGAQLADNQLMEELDRTVRTRVVTREFCITKLGRLALLPPTARNGDFIVLLNDARSPYVLRPLSNDEYAMIGEAYVSGLTVQQMDDYLLNDCQHIIIR